MKTLFRGVHLSGALSVKTGTPALEAPCRRMNGMAVLLFWYPGYSHTQVQCHFALVGNFTTGGPPERPNFIDSGDGSGW